MFNESVPQVNMNYNVRIKTHTWASLLCIQGFQVLQESFEESKGVICLFSGIIGHLSPSSFQVTDGFRAYVKAVSQVHMLNSFPAVTVQLTIVYNTVMSRSYYSDSDGQKITPDFRLGCACLPILHAVDNGVATQS